MANRKPCARINFMGIAHAILLEIIAIVTRTSYGYRFTTIIENLIDARFCVHWRLYGRDPAAAISLDSPDLELASNFDEVARNAG